MYDIRENTSSLVIRKDDDEISFLTLNRPKAYNALSIECMETLTDQLEEISNDPSVKLIVISGSGKGFCAGHDLKELRENKDKDFYDKTFNTCSKMLLTIRHSPKPVIAKVHGIATAAGCQLVATCDLAVAEENAKFATPGVNIGLFCSTPMVALTRSVARKHAMEMLLTGEMTSAQKAYEIGLINRVVTFESLDEAVKELAGKIKYKSPLTLRIGKEAFYKQIEMDIENAYEYCGRVMVDNLMTQDADEGIDAFLEKRDPIWSGE